MTVIKQMNKRSSVCYCAVYLSLSPPPLFSLLFLCLFIYAYVFLVGVFSCNCCQHKDSQLLLLTCCLCCAAGDRLLDSFRSETQTPRSPCVATICPPCWCHQLSGEGDVMSLALVVTHHCVLCFCVLGLCAVLVWVIELSAELTISIILLFYCNTHTGTHL